MEFLVFTLSTVVSILAIYWTSFGATSLGLTLDRLFAPKDSERASPSPSSRGTQERSLAPRGKRRS